LSNVTPDPLSLAGEDVKPFSLGNTQEHRQTALNLNHCIRINASKRLPWLVSLHGHCLVHHDLRRLLQTVSPTWLDGDAKQRRINQRAGNQQDSDRCVLVEQVSLNNQRRSWFAQNGPVWRWSQSRPASFRPAIDIRQRFIHEAQPVRVGHVKLSGQVRLVAALRPP